MPQVAAAAVIAGGVSVAAGVATGSILTAAAAWSAFATAAGSTLVLGGINYAMAKDREAAARFASTQDPGRTTTVRQPAAPRRVIYGTSRVGGVYAYIGNTGPRNVMLHMAIMWAGHECESVDDILINDRSYTDSRYDSVAVSGSDTIGFESEGGNRGLITSSLIDGPDLNSAISDNSGAIFSVEGSSSNDGVYQIVESGRNDDTTSYQLRVRRIDRDTPIVDEAAGASITLRRKYVYVTHHLGDPDQAADPDMVAALDDWTSDHRLRGICYSYISLAYEPKVFPSGIPNITAVVSGKKVYDPRSASTAWSENTALCLADYLTDETLGLGADYDTAIGEAALTAAANACEEQVNLAGGGTADRYTCNGSFTSDTAPEDIIPKLAASMAGSAVKSGGQWIIRAGAYETPTVELTDDDLRGPIQVTPRLPRDQIYNAVRATYVNAADSYVESDAPPVTNATYQAQDNGRRIWQDLDLPFTTNAAEAQRLMKIALEQQRQQITVTYPAKLTALQLRAGDTVYITRDRYGWDQKPFVVEEWSFAVHDDENGEPALGVDLQLRETASTVYDWSSGEETEVDPAPDTNLEDPYDIPAPSNLGVTHLPVIQTDGGLQTRTQILWDAPEATIDGYVLQVREDASNYWSTIDTTTPSVVLNGLQADTLHQVRVAARSLVGGLSPWLYGSFTTQGVGTAPGAPTGLTATNRVGFVELTWTNPSDTDLRGVRVVASEDNDRANAVFVAEVGGAPGDTGGYNHALNALDGRYYWVQAVNRSGLASDYHPSSATAGVFGEAQAATPSFQDVLAFTGTARMGFDTAEQLGAWLAGAAGESLVGDADASTGAQAGLFTSTNASITSPADATRWEVPDEVAQTLAGNRVRVQFRAKQPSSGAAAEFAVALWWPGKTLTWADFTPATSYGQHGFLEDIPESIDYLRVLVHGDTAGGGGGTLVDDLSVFMVPKQITAANVDTWIGSAAIGDAKITSLSAAKFVAGSGIITTLYVGDPDASQTQIQIDGPNRRFRVLDQNGQERVRLGRLGSGLDNYGITIRAADGTIILQAGAAGQDQFNADYITAGTITGRTLRTAASGTRFEVSAADGEGHYFGDRGDGTVIELATIGISSEFSDTTIGRFGAQSSSHRGIVARSGALQAVYARTESSTSTLSAIYGVGVNGAKGGIFSNGHDTTNDVNAVGLEGISFTADVGIGVIGYGGETGLSVGLRSWNNGVAGFPSHTPSYSGFYHGQSGVFAYDHEINDWNRVCMSGAAAGEIGTFAFATYQFGSSVGFGSTTSGSNLVTADATGDEIGGSGLSGTWRCMGNSGGNDSPTLWMRIE